MAAVTRVNGTGHVDATLYSTGQLGGFICTLDGGAPSTGIGGLLESVMQELGSTAMLAEADGAKIMIIGDAHALDTDTLAARIGNVTGATETVTAMTSLFGN